jgi:hypothetical protein
MSDPVLEYLKSVKQDIREMRSDLSAIIKDHDNRIDNLEDAHAEQRGMVKLAGVLITTVSGIVAFLVSHFKH